MGNLFFILEGESEMDSVLLSLGASFLSALG
jgi:hypothetical protein